MSKTFSRAGLIGFGHVDDFCFDLLEAAMPDPAMTNAFPHYAPQSVTKAADSARMRFRCANRDLAIVGYTGGMVGDALRELH